MKVLFKLYVARIHMTPERRNKIDARWLAVDQELADLADAKTMPDVQDLARREEELLEEQEHLEYELGIDFFETRDGKSD